MSPRHAIGLVIILGTTWFVLSMIVFPGCRYSPNPTWVETSQASRWPRDLLTLADDLTGSFSSQQQHEQNPDNYDDIRLHMMRIWPDRSDGVWLYVEQAVADTADKPYRQRVYRLRVVSSSVVDGSLFESAVFEFDSNPLRYAGAWKSPALLRSVTPESLTQRAGCSILLHKRSDGAFRGATQGQECPNNLKGATYATSEVTITPSKLVSWDRGFDSSGQQVWGATKGGYVFKRLLR